MYPNKVNHIALSILIVLLCGCRTTNRLTEDDLRWIPYEGNEILVFNSDSGESDTIFLLGISRYINPSDPLDIFPKKLEHLTILARSSDPNPPRGVEHRYLERAFLELSRTVSGSSYLTIHHSGKDAWFYGGSFLPLNDLDTMTSITLETKSGTYKDVLKFKPESDEYSNRGNFIDAVYWSKSAGLIRYDKRDGVIWTIGERYHSDRR